MRVSALALPKNQAIAVPPVSVMTGVDQEEETKELRYQTLKEFCNNLISRLFCDIKFASS